MCAGLLIQDKNRQKVLIASVHAAQAGGLRLQRRGEELAVIRSIRRFTYE